MKVEFERPLQTLESIIAEGQEKKGDVTDLPTSELKLTRKINIGLMKRVVNDIVIRHPNLRAVIVEKEGQDIPKEKRFSLNILESTFALEKFTFFEHILLKDNEKWDFSVAERQVSRPPGVGPDSQQFRVVLATPLNAVYQGEMESSLTDPVTVYLMVFYNHAICDGMGGYILTNDILQRYTELYNDEHIANKKYAIVPTIEELSRPESNKEILEPSKDKKVIALIADLDHRNDVYQNCMPLKSSADDIKKSGCVCLRGTAEGMLKLKSWCKEAKVTMGMGILGAVYCTLAKFRNEVPIVNIDVDLRRRFEATKDKSEIPPRVALLIGMTSAHRVAKIEKTDDFKSYVRRLHGELKRSLDDGEHFSFRHVIKQRWLNDSPDFKDMNFSNLGLYPYPTKFEASGLEITGYWRLGNAWCPLMFGNMVFLINTIPGAEMFYTMAFEDYEDNRQFTTDVVKSIRHLCENPEEGDRYLSEIKTLHGI